MYHPELIRHPDSCPALVLNADYTPLSYYPLSLWPWQTAIKAMGGDLEIRAVFPEGTVRIHQFRDIERAGRRPPKRRRT